MSEDEEGSSSVIIVNMLKERFGGSRFKFCTGFYEIRENINLS